MKLARPLAVLLLALLLITGSASRPAVVRLALLGDLMLGRAVNPSPASLAWLAPEISSADLALANLESPLASAPMPAASTYNLCAPSSRADLLAAWGFDLLAVSNNHSFDCGPQGPAETRSILESSGITPLGPALGPVLRKVNGLSLAFFAFDDVASSLDEDAALQAVRSARLGGSIVVVSIHWGMEYQGGASDRQKLLAREFLDAGTLLVWGHHPHVLQPSDGCRPSSVPRPVVFYSLGNALFDQAGLAGTRQSALALVNLNSQGVIDVRVVPFVIDIRSSRLLAPDAGTSLEIRQRLGLP